MIVPPPETQLSALLIVSLLTGTIGLKQQAGAVVEL
jgi:hypothetical protein